MKRLPEKILKGGVDRYKFQSLWFYLSAFALPFAIMLIAFIALNIYPFGNTQIMAQDAWHQHYPFLVELYRKIRNGESLFYDWRNGLGGDFLSLMAYYLASPLNLLTLFFPAAFLREAFALLIFTKIGFAGAFCAFALHRFYGRREYGIIIFSTLYALCSWACCYYNHIMWLDTFAIFPLVVTGIWMLVREKKYGLYILSLTFAIFANYYIGLLVCIFTVIYFFAQCIICQNDWKTLGRNLKNIISSSVIALLISAVVLLPVVMTMSMQSSIADNNSSARWSIARGWVETLANMLAYREIDINNHELPNLYCGVICILFLFAYYRLRGISKREKAVHIALVLFFLVGVNFDMLSYLLNGFHTPVGLPYRFSFMLSFLLIVSACRVYCDMDTLTKSDWRFMCLSGIVFYLLVSAEEILRICRENPSGDVLATLAADEAGTAAILVKNMFVIAAYLILTFPAVRKKLSRKEFTLLLAFLVELELVPTVMAGTESVGVTDRSSYPDKYDEVREILDGIDIEEADGNFYRVAFTETYTHNDPMLYGYQGISIFSSTANRTVINLFQNMGVGAAKNKYLYYNATPIVNLFLDLKYLIAKDSEVANKEYLTDIRQVNGVSLYQNEAYLPIGFMVDEEMAEFQFSGETPFENQSRFLKTAAGIEEDVFEALDIIHVEHENLDVLRYGYGIYTYEPLEGFYAADNIGIDGVNGEKEAGGETLHFNYEMPCDGCAYVYMNVYEGDDACVEFHGESYEYDIRQPNTFPAGTYRQGDIFSVKAKISPEIEIETPENLRIYVSVLNEEVFDKAYEILKDETLQVTEFTDRGLTGSILVKEDGLLYTSIPYERGWKVYVDGREAEITLIADSLMGVMLPQGEHTIEFQYNPIYAYAAVVLSGIGIVLLILRVIYDRKRSK